jgi:hypothetical protein
MLTRLLPAPLLMALLSVFMALPSCAGCPSNANQFGIDSAQCAAGAVSGALVGLVNQAEQSALAGGPTWSDFAKGPLLQQGLSAAICVAQAAIHDFAAQVPRTGQADPRYLEAIDLLDRWLIENGGQSPMPDHVHARLKAYRAARLQ